MRTIYPQLNEEVLAQLREELQLSSEYTLNLDFLTTVVTDCSYIDGEALIKGRFSPANKMVTLYVANFQEIPKLSVMKRDMTVTALHEFRHAYQWEHWPTEDCMRDELIEPDAQAWSEKNAMKYIRLIDLNNVVKSKLSRLSQAEERVR